MRSEWDCSSVIHGSFYIIPLTPFLAFLSLHEDQSNLSQAVPQKPHSSGGPLDEDEDEELVRGRLVF